MEKEFDFLNDKALCVINDTEPCVIKYNGETVRKLSAIKSTEQGTTEVTYNSEYKKNLLNMSVEGNTFQQTYEGYNLAYCSLENRRTDRVTMTILSLNSFVAQKTVGSTGNSSSLAFGVPVKPNTNYTFTCKYSKTGTQGSAPRFLFYRTSSLTSVGTYISSSSTPFSNNSGTVKKTINTGDTSFLGICLYVWESTAPSEDFSILIEEFMLVEGTVTKPYEPYVGGIPSPNVEYPQPIENSGSSSLPTEYQQVEYIESTGTQYIDTGVTGKNTLSFYVKTNSGANTLFGAEDTTDTNKCMAIAGSTWEGNDTDYIRYLTTNGIPLVVKLSSYDNYVLEISNTKATVYYDKQSNTISLTPTDNTVNYTIYLFARNKDGIASSFSARKIYLFKIYESDVLIRDFIPCYRKADNVIGLYDLVNNVFYTNQGTGTFLKGKDVIGLSAELSGVNLFDYKAIQLNYGTSTTDLGNGILVETPNATSKISIVYFRPFEVEEGVNYRISLDCAFLNSHPDSVRPNEIMVRASNDTSTSTTNDKILSIWKLGTSAELSTKKTSFKMPVGYKYLKIQFYANVGNSDSIEDYQATLKNIIVSKDDWLPYQPYFAPTKVDIPSEVTLADGTIVPLRFAKVDDSADTLIVDKISNKVKYIKKVEYGTPSLDYASHYKNFGNSVILYDMMSSKESSAKGYCNRAKVSTFSKNVIVIGAGTNYVYWLSILDTLGFTSSWVDKSNPTSEEKKQATTDFRAWLKENPTYIYYELSNPIEYDLTNTDLGQQLLTLANNTQNATNIINISADVPVSKLNVDFAIWGGRENENN